jgi:cytochrome c-type biogenesis protein CcmH/NrfG
MRFFPRLLSASLFSALVLTASAQTLNEKVAALIEQKEYFAAERLIEPATKAKNADAFTLYQFSLIRAAQLRYEDAVKLVERAIKIDSSKPEYFAHLGKTLSERAAETNSPFLLSPMRRAFERSIKLDPNYLPGLLGLVRFYSSATVHSGGDLKKARDYAERVAKIDALQGHLELGNVDLRSGKHADALAHFRQVIQLKPDHVSAHYSSGVALMQLAQRDEARAMFQKALQLDPTYESAKTALENLAKLEASVPLTK